MTLFTCEKLQLAYEGNTVLDNLSFSVSKGDYLCIVGENGSGKSTLMKALLGLMKPTKGEIKYLNGLKHNEIGYLPQQTEIQRDFPASVWEVVISGTLSRRGIKPFYSKEEKEIAKKNMELLSIDNIKRKSYQKQWFIH